jgi:HPt (histidine-containing phosphotransfer) domain-containing protein
MQTKESTHPADLWLFEFHWIDVALPQEVSALAYDSSAQTLLDGLTLKIIKSADADAAQAMCALSLGLAAAQSALEPRVFWKICAAYFEAVALGLCTPDVYTKRAASQILLAYRKLARGEPDLSGRLLHDLLFFCAHAVPKQETDAPFLAAVRDAFGLTEPEPEESVKVIGSLRVGIAPYNVYLNEADEWSRCLLTELSEWALELHRPMPQSTVGLIHSLAVSSEMIGFHALAEMARVLESALQQAQTLGQGNPEQAKVFVEAAEDIRRLLHQFAAGFLKQPDPALLVALKAIIDTCPPTQPCQVRPL